MLPHLSTSAIFHKSKWNRLSLTNETWKDLSQQICSKRKLKTILQAKKSIPGRKWYKTKWIALKSDYYVDRTKRVSRCYSLTLNCSPGPKCQRLRPQFVLLHRGGCEIFRPWEVPSEDSGMSVSSLSSLFSSSRRWTASPATHSHHGVLPHTTKANQPWPDTPNTGEPK